MGSGMERVLQKCKYSITQKKRYFKNNISNLCNVKRGSHGRTSYFHCCQERFCFYVFGPQVFVIYIILCTFILYMYIEFVDILFLTIFHLCLLQAVGGIFWQNQNIGFIYMLCRPLLSWPYFNTHKALYHIMHYVL